MIRKEERDKLQDGRKPQAQRMRSGRTGTAHLWPDGGILINPSAGGGRAGGLLGKL